MKTITTLQELEEIIKTSEKVLVKIGQEGCGPCRLLESNMSSIEPEFPEVAFVTIDATECEESLIDGIMSVPVLKYYKDSELIATMNGLKTKDQLKEILK